MIEDLKLVIDSNIPLRDAVFITLRDAIMKGILVPGQHLMELPLAHQLGVSRTPVREAIHMLELEGLVIMAPHKGARVAAISEKDLIDVLEVRTALEELAVRLACSRIEYKDLEKLEEINQKFIDACRSSRNDIIRIAQLDEEFHQLIYEVANNDKLLQLLNQMMGQMYRFRIEHIKLKERRQVLIGEHKVLIMALANRNEEAAIDAIRKHISNQEQYIMNEIQAHV